MKIVFGKPIKEERERGRDAVDRFYLRHIDQILGIKEKIHAAKYTDAIGHLAGQPSPLISGDDEAHDIIERRLAKMGTVAAAEQQRQIVQAEIDNCQNAAEVDAVLAKYQISTPRGA